MTVTTTRQSFQKTAANRSHAITVAAKFLRTNMLYVGATCVLTTASVATGQGVDSIYDTGSILTLAGKDPACVEALAVKDGKIIFTESKDAGLKMKGDSTKVVDLSGKTLLPRLTRRTQPIQHEIAFRFSGTARTVTRSRSQLASPDRPGGQVRRHFSRCRFPAGFYQTASAGPAHA